MTTPWGTWPPEEAVAGPANALQVPGPTNLAIDPIADGAILERVGLTITGVSLAESEFLQRRGGANVGNDFPIGLARLPAVNFFSAALAGGVGAFADFPGPAVGFVRVYEALYFVSNTLAAPLVNVSVNLQPVGYAWVAAQSGAITLASSGTTPIPAGESWRVVNGGVTAGRIMSTYYDVPAAGWTFVRQALTIVPATLIPAPAAGLYNRLPQIGQFLNNARSLVLVSRTINRDTIAHSVQLTLGGNMIARSTAVAAGNLITPLGPVYASIDAGTGALEGATTEAVVTTAPIFIGSYQTFAS